MPARQGGAKTSASDSGSGGDRRKTPRSTGTTRDTAFGSRDAASRYDAFEQLARERAEGRMVPLPRQLTGQDRRVHVRQTLREDHEQRVAHHSEDALTVDKLAGSLYSFFRGTSLLFYRDMAGEDALMPTVLCLGDVHPEDFGVMPSADNVPCFGSTTSTRPTTPRSPGTSCVAPSAS